jgi:hypothetical protein
MGGISIPERTIHFDAIRTVNVWIYRAWTEFHLHKQGFFGGRVLLSFGHSQQGSNAFAVLNSALTFIVCNYNTPQELTN